MDEQKKELKKLILDTLLKSIGCMVLIEANEYARQIADIYADIETKDFN